MSMTDNENQDLSVRDSLLVDNIMRTVAADSSTAWRFRTIVKMNPYMANRPEAVAAMANMPIPTQDLMSQAGALYGMQVGNGFGAQLKQYDPSTQRSIFGQLTPGQQNTLLAFGYELPKEDVHGKGLLGEIFSAASWPLAKVFGGIGRTVSPVVGPTLEALTTIGDYPFKIYRTIRQLDDASQWIALATGLAATAGVLLAPATGGGSLALTATLTAARTGLALSAGMAAAGASSLIASSVQTGGTSTWMNAWSAAYNGERLFSQSGLRKAEALLEDPSLTALAQDLAAESEYPGDLLGIARELAGVRGSDDPSVRTKQLEKVAAKYASPDTPQFAQAYDLLSELLTLPAFTEAVSILERSKISMGRDIVRFVGGDPSTGWGRWVSGSIDAASIFLIDPFLLAGAATRGVAQARRGIQFIDGVHSADRIRQVAQLPEMQRKLRVVARAVEAGDISLLNRGAREYRPIFDQLVQHRRVAKPEVFGANDVVDWLVGTDKLKSIMKGVGVIPGSSYGSLRGLNRGQYAWAQATGAVRDSLRGIADVRIENVRLPQIVKDINVADIANVSDETITQLTGFGLSRQAATVVANFLSNLPTRAILGQPEDDIYGFYRAWVDDLDVDGLEPALSEADTFLTNALKDSSLAYQVGRTVGNMPFVGQILSPFANFVEGITTRIPGGAIHLTGLDAPDEIRNFIELFRYTGMPSYVRNMWTNAILQSDTAGARLNGITALIDSAATATGMRLTKSGTDLIDEFLEKTRQMYSLGSTGRYATGFESGLTQPIGVRPVADMADMVAIPDLATMRKAVKQGVVIRAMLGIPENTHVLALQNKYWKPAVLLRAGFILRNISEEMLSMLTRYSIGSWSQELTGRKIAQREEYFAAEKKSRIKNQNSYLSPYESHVIRNRYDVPSSLRPLARAIDRIPDGQPWQKVLYDLGNYVVNFASRTSERTHSWLMHGFGGQAASRMRAIGDLANEETARGRLNTIISRLAYGNQYSLRRMIIGGIDETILNDMRAFEGIYLKQIMDKVGTSNLAPWERTGNRAEALQRVLIDENSNERTELVTVHGERALSTRSNNMPNQQPWSEAVLSRTQELFDDPIVEAAMGPVRLVYNADIEAGLSRVDLVNALVPYAQHLASGQRWDEDFLNLFLLLNQGTPRPDRFRALLNRMYIPDDALEELAAKSDTLYAWAVRRNEVVKFLQTSFPGQRIPDWPTLSRIMKTAHDDFLNVEFIRRLPEGVEVKAATDIKGEFAFPLQTSDAENVVDIADGAVDQLGYMIGYQRLKDQFAVFDEMAEALTNANELGRDWFTSLIIGWHRDPELLHLPSVLNMTPDMARTRPTFLAYRGMQYDDLVEITDEGDLIFKGTGRDWTDWNPSISFSLSDYQASNYARGQVGGQRPGANEVNLLFTINGDALLEAAGKSVDDVIGGMGYQLPSRYRRIVQGGDIFVHTPNGPKFPFISVDMGDVGRREISITDLSRNDEIRAQLEAGADVEQFTTPDGGFVIRLPRGSWNAQIVGDTLPEIVEGTKRAAILDNSTRQGYWPFYSSFDEARSAVKWNGHVAASDPRFGADLRKNVDWHGMPETTPAYVVDARPLALGTRQSGSLGPNTVDEDLLAEAVNAEVTFIQTKGDFDPYDIAMMVTDAINEQAPIIATTKETADLFANIIKRFVKNKYQTSVDRPLVAVTYFPVDAQETISGFARYEFAGRTADGKDNTFGVYGWSGEEESLANYRDFPLVWDWLDSIEVPPGPGSIIDRMVDHIEQRVRGGRRLQLFYREGENVAPVYRNVNGEPVALEPGEMIQAHEQLFNSERMRPGDRVQPGDQRYFEQGELTYEGSSELVWPVLAPVMFDRTESSLGWTLYDLKAPVDVPTVGNRRNTIYTDRQRIRYATRDHVDKTPAGDLPDWEIVQLYRPVKKNLWERGVEYGFSNIIGPTIDAITRKPMAAHAFHIAAERNRNLTKWLISSSEEESALRNVITQLNARTPDAQVTPEATKIWADFGRVVGDLHGVSEASRWDDLQSIAFLRGFDTAEYDEIFAAIDRARTSPDFAEGTMVASMSKADLARLDASIDFVKKNYDQLHAGQFDQTPDAFLNMIDRLFGKGATLEGRLVLSTKEYDALPQAAKNIYNAITKNDWEVIVRSAKQRASINEEVYDYAAEHTIRDIMPFVDSHEIRSQFAETMRGILPFWYAEENFLKRWAKIFTEGGPAVTFERIRKLQLTYQGLKSVGIVRSDAQGRDYFVYPGSELLFDAVDAVLPGQRLPLEALIQTPTAQMIPGFTRDFGRPSLTPFVGMSMDVVTTLMPEARPLEEALIGKEYVFNSIVDSVVPRHVANVWQALGDYFNTDINPKNERVASAMMAAIAHLDASGEGLADNATAAQRDDYLRRVRDHARIIVLSQALGGFFTAGPAQLVQIPEGGSLDWITGGAVTNPAELLSSQYYELVRNLGIEKGTQRYLELNPDANINSVLNPLAYTVSRTTSPSGAPLPQTDEAYNFYTDNQDLLSQYPEASPWLLPQLRGEQDSRSQYAYDSELVTGMRERRTPQEFLTMLKYKEGASYYFSQQKIYEEAYKQLKLSNRSERASELNRQWLVWAETYKATHPLFAEMLVSDDARQRRRRVIDQMRYLIDDPLVPKADHFEALKVLQNSYDAYSAARGELGLDRTARGISALNNLKTAFNSWVSDYLLENPVLVSYWQTILEPEAGLE